MNRINSQEGSGEASKDEKKRKKGHMALRNNVYDLKLELWRTLKPIEYYLVDIIIDKTIKWRTKEARIDIAEFVQRTGNDEKYLYAALRNLIKKKVINKRRDKHYTYYGLNEEFFGELLIAKHEKAWQERRNKIKLAVDNSKSGVSAGHQECAGNTPQVCSGNTNSSVKKHQNDNQENEIIEENDVLKTSLKDISIKTSLKDSKNSESFTLSGTGTEAEQAEKARAYIRSMTSSMRRMPR